MDNQKQIEEMAKVVCGGGHIDYERCGDCFGEEDGFCGCIGLVERLYNAGVRKIPENAVVVPDMAGKDFYAVEKAEWDKMVQGAKDIIHEREEKVRKETAEKIAERLKENAHWFVVGKIQKDHFCECLDEICKEISEGCDE